MGKVAWIGDDVFRGIFWFRTCSAIVVRTDRHICLSLVNSIDPELSRTAEDDYADDLMQIVKAAD